MILTKVLIANTLCMKIEQKKTVSFELLLNIKDKLLNNC